MSRTLVRRVAATATAAIAAALLAAPAIAHAAPSPAGAAQQKPKPAVPANAYRPEAVAHLPAKKPAARSTATSGFVPWDVTLNASARTLWPTQYTTLTATATNDVANTPYYIMIYESSGGAERLLAFCDFGTTCSVSVTSATSVNMTYEADIATTPTSFYPPLGTITWGSERVEWVSDQLSLTARATTAAPGQSVVLTATSSLDIGSSPFDVEIFDATTGTPLVVCVTGTLCTWTASQDAGTHRYVAYSGPYSLKFPPVAFQTRSASAWATRSASGWTVSLASSGTALTATVNRETGPTPYWITVYLQSDNDNGTAVTGTRVGTCGSGTSCVLSVANLPAQAGDLVAFVSDNSPAFPPTGIQAVSNTIPYSPPIS